MYKQRIQQLEEAHKLLDKQIDTIVASNSYTDEAVNELKKKKLLYKDEIRRLNRLQWDHDHNTVDFDNN